MDAINGRNMDAVLLHTRSSSTDRQVAGLQSKVTQQGSADVELKEASEQFESLMLHFMIREMRATVPESSLFPRSMAEDIFKGMLDETIAGEMAQNGGIGISRMIFEQLRSEKQGG